LEEYKSAALRMATNSDERLVVAEYLRSRISHAQWPPSDQMQAEAFMHALTEIPLNQ
jgi:hypothetical protein